jgi:sensor histidine kinase regulating citrate/malate metabolism
MLKVEDGLYLIKSQLDILLGTIAVDSAPDQGTLFKVMLPLRMEELKKDQLKSGMAIKT